MKSIYPDGMMNSGDEGELKIATYIKDGRVIIDFGKDLSWLGFDKDTLRAFIDGLENKYKQI